MLIFISILSSSCISWIYENDQQLIMRYHFNIKIIFRFEVQDNQNNYDIQDIMFKSFEKNRQKYIRKAGYKDIQYAL